MKTPAVLRLSLILTALLVFGSSCSSPSGPGGTAAPATDWHVASTANSMTNVWAFAPDDIQATAPPLLYRYDGDVWRVETLPDELSWGAVADWWFQGRSEGFVVGRGGQIHRWDGRHYAPMQSGTDRDLWAVWGSRNGRAFAVGDAIVAFDGRSWRVQQDGTGGTLLDVWGSSEKDVFAVGRYGTIVHYDGRRWETMESPASEATLLGVWGSAPANVYAVGIGGSFIHYDGGRWSVVSVPTDETLTAVGGTGPNDIVVSSDGLSLHYDGQSWSIRNDGTYVSTIFSSPRLGIIGAGGLGQVVDFGGGKPHRLLYGTANDYVSCWGDGNTAFIVSNRGDVRRLRDGAWTDYVNVIGGGLTDVWGASPSDVFVAGTSNNIAHFDGSLWTPLASGLDRAQFRGIWGTAGDNVYFSGADVTAYRRGLILRWNGSTFTEVGPPQAQPLWGIWGTSDSDIMVVGERGAIFHFDGSEWTAMESGTTSILQSVWGDAPDRYFAVSRTRELFQYDGTAWRRADVEPRDGFYDVFGEGSDVFAAALQDGVYHRDGGRWTSLDVPDKITYVSTWRGEEFGTVLTGRFGIVLVAEP